MIHLLSRFGLTRAAATGPTVLASDAFTDADGTSLAAHTPDAGGPWTVSGEGATPGANIQGNALQFTGNNTNATLDVGASDVIVSADWTPAVGATNRNSLLARYASDAAYWALNIREENGDINIYKCASGVFTTMAIAAFAWAEGTTYHVEFKCNGATLEGYVDGVLVVSYGSATAPGTRAGLRRDTGATASRFDNFQVTAL